MSASATYRAAIKNILLEVEGAKVPQCPIAAVATPMRVS